jgi:hypothetical protein
MTFTPEMPKHLRIIDQRVVQVSNGPRSSDGTKSPRMAFILAHPKFTGEEPCTEVGTEVFDNDRLNGNETVSEIMERSRLARKLCDQCPIKNECAEWGIAHERYLMWGGLTPRERERERTRRKWIVVTPEYAHTYFPLLNDPRVTVEENQERQTRAEYRERANAEGRTA